MWTHSTPFDHMVYIDGKPAATDVYRDGGAFHIGRIAVLNSTAPPAGRLVERLEVLALNWVRRKSCLARSFYAIPFYENAVSLVRANASSRNSASMNACQNRHAL